MNQKGKIEHMNREEDELIQKICDGDVSAFRELMKNYQQHVYNLSYDMTGNYHDAKDLTQEVFIKAYHSISNFRGDAKFSSWLYRIAVNTFIDKKRKKKLSFVGDQDDIAQPEQAQENTLSTENPEHQAELSLLKAKIQKSLAKLSSRERSVFVLRHYHDLPIKEVSEVLNLSAGTIKSLFFRALKKLQTELAVYQKDFGLEETT